MKKGTLFSLSLLFGICLLLFACKRDIDNYLHDRKEAPSMLLESAKIWHMQHLEMDGTLKLKPYWKDAWTVKSTSGKTLILVPAPEQHISSKDYSIRRFFVFSGNEVAINNGLIIELLGENYDVNDQFDFVLKQYDSEKISGFNGGILQYDINYFLLKSVYYHNGTKVSSSVEINNEKKVPQNSIAINTKGGLKTNDVCGPPNVVNVGFPAYEAPAGCVFLWIARTQYIGACPMSVTNTYLNTDCSGVCTSCGSGGGLGSGSGSGSSSGNSPNYGGGGVPPYITDNLTDECSKNVLMLLRQDNLNTTVGNIINNVFDTNSSVNLIFEQEVNTSRNEPAKSQVIGTPTNNRYTQKITLNMHSLNSASQEFRAVVIVHEIIHAYMNYNNQYYQNALKQHQAMAETYVEDIRGVVKAIYPAMPDQDAYAIVLNGLSDAFGNSLPTYYNTLKTKYNVTDPLGTYELYRGGLLGTSCNQ